MKQIYLYQQVLYLYWLLIMLNYFHLLLALKNKKNFNYLPGIWTSNISKFLII